MDAIGIDIGRVIIGPTIDGVEDTAFIGRTVQEAMQSSPALGAFAAVAELMRRFDGRVWLVSKCGPSVERKTLLWLDHWRFHEQTCLPKSHVRFCRERPEKAEHARQLGLTHFIDDRLDVLDAMRGLVPHLFAFGEETGTVPEWTIRVRDWNAVRAWFGPGAADAPRTSSPSTSASSPARGPRPGSPPPG